MAKPWRRHLRAWFALSTLLIYMAAARADEGGAPRSDDQAVTFCVAQLPSALATGADATAKRRVLRQFLESHPNYNIEPFQMPSVQGAGMDSAPLMGIASGQPPHAMYVNFRQSSSYINHGFLAPLEVLLARVLSDDLAVREVDAQGRWLADPTPQEIDRACDQIRSRVVPRVWPVIYREADVDKPGIPRGEHVWAMPTDTLVQALLYRKDLFQAAGLDPERPPKTWDELLEASRAINALPGKTGLVLAGGPVIAWSTYSFMTANGVRYMRRNDDGQWEAAFNTDAAAETIYYVSKLARDRYTRGDKTFSGSTLISTNFQEIDMRWSRGDIGMRFSYLEQDQIGDINPELVGIAPVPSPNGGEPSGELNCGMLGVFAGCSPAQQLAVMRYIWFITGEQAEQTRTRTMVDFGYGKFLNPRLLEKYGYDDILRQVPQHWRKTYETAMAHGVPEPYGRNTQFIYAKVSEPINWALNVKGLLDLPPDVAKKRIREQLDVAADRVDRYMLGKLTTSQWRERRLIGGSALAVVLLLFTAAIVYVWRAFTVAERSGGLKRGKLRRYWKAYAMMLPALLVVFLWQYGPVLMGLPLALFDFELTIKSTFVGIDNFATVLYDSRFWSSLARTLYYVLLVVGLGFWPPILVALLLEEVPTATLKYTFRTVYYLPAVISGVIMTFLWLQFYQPGEDGILNQIMMSVNTLGPVAGTLLKWVLLGAWLSLIGLLIVFAVSLRELSLLMRGTIFAFVLALIVVSLMPLVTAYQGPGPVELEAMRLKAQAAGLTFDADAHRGLSAVLQTLGHLVGRWRLSPSQWVHDPGLAMICVVIPGVWATAGPGCIIYLAALKTVPEELVEAATIDGAGIVQKVAYITLPRIKFLILIQLVGAVVSAFKGGTDIILAMTGGGPNGATRVLGMEIFEASFMELRYGAGAAMAWLLGALVIALTAYQLKRISQAEFKTTDTAQENVGGVPATAPVGAQ